jgi:hypothetical protein
MAVATQATPEPVQTTSTSSFHFTVNYLVIANQSSTETNKLGFRGARPEVTKYSERLTGAVLNSFRRKRRRTQMIGPGKLPQPAQGFEGVCQRGPWQRHENTTADYSAVANSDLTQPPRTPNQESS